MLRAASGWLSDPEYVNRWDIKWIVADPTALLMASRRSPYPPNGTALQRLCDLYYPDITSTLWPHAGDPNCLGQIRLHSID